MKICIIGGDKRNKHLSEQLSAEGINNDILYLGSDNNQYDIEEYDLIIGPIPFSKNDKDLYTPLIDDKIKITEFLKKINKNATLMAGTIKIKKDFSFNYIDLTKNKELYDLNITATIEGVLQILLNEQNSTIKDSKILLLGFGNIGKSLADLLDNLGSQVTIYDKVKIETRYKSVENINNLNGYDIIINTIPTIILKQKNLSTVDDNIFIIDVASYPGGIDQNFINKTKIKYIIASGLPGKKAPITVAKNMKKVISKIYKINST